MLDLPRCPLDRWHNLFEPRGCFGCACRIEVAAGQSWAIGFCRLLDAHGERYDKTRRRSFWSSEVSVEAIEPFKGLSVGVFLIAVGMSLDIALLVPTHGSSWVPPAALVVAALSRAFGLNWGNSLHTGLLLGPGGEFAFVIVSVAPGEHLLYIRRDACYSWFAGQVNLDRSGLRDRHFESRAAP